MFYRQENAELRRRERQFMVQKRMVETTWARVQKVQAMVRTSSVPLSISLPPFLYNDNP